MSSLVEALSACAGFGFFFLYTSLFEYAFHRWILHRPWRVLLHPYEIHTFLHHEVFCGDETFHVQREEDRGSILFEWWQGPLIVAAHAPAIWGLELLSGLPLFWGGIAALAVYYGLYEYLHWCMHCPAGRWIERTRVFRYLNAHHRLHHGLWRTNFNVVFPLGDLVFGTFRSVPSGCPQQGGSPEKFR